MSDSQLLVGIIIVVNNRKNELLRLFESVYKLNYTAYHILVIDSGSTDDISEVKEYPRVEYVRFNNNVGFVAGMVFGLSHLYLKNIYKFLWILDSDLEVAPESLTRLVEVISVQENIGVAGCIIYNTHNREVVVEAGADVCLRSGIVTPRHCNERSYQLDKMIEVDFIASGGGGSLISIEALKVAGFHDDRYHFLWEDIDFGLCMKKNGYRSVVISDAVLYHPPFTEKRNPNIYAYYGVRNPLLTVAKYTNGMRLPWYLYGNLSRYLRIGLLTMFSGSNAYTQLTFRAIFDYILGRFGKADLADINQAPPHIGGTDLSCEKRVFILGLANRNAIQSAVSYVKARGHGEIILVIQNYRYALFEDINVDSVMTFDDRSPKVMREYLRVGMYILRQGGCIINTDLKVASPLSYFGRRTFNWDDSIGQIYCSNLNIYFIWKPAAAVILGHLLALFFLPFVLIASLRHKAKKPVFP